MFTWRETEHDQREPWFLARVAHFEPTRDGMTAEELEHLREWRWWTVAELLADGPPAAPVDVGP